MIIPVKSVFCTVLIKVRFCVINGKSLLKKPESGFPVMSAMSKMVAGKKTRREQKPAKIDSEVEKGSKESSRRLTPVISNKLMRMLHRTGCVGVI